MSDHPCPHPYKRAYHTKKAAKRLYMRQRGREDCRVYRCECGAFHLGHRLSARKREAMNA